MNPLTLFGLFSESTFQLGLLTGAGGLLLLATVRKAGWLLVWAVAAAAALAWSVGWSLPPTTPGWALGAIVPAAAASIWAFRVLLGRAPAWSVGLVFALWVLGVWGTVPDTEPAIPVLGAAAALLPGLLPKLEARLGWWAAPLATLVLGLVASAGGAARPSTIAASLAMVAMPTAAAASALLLHKGVKLSGSWLVGAQALHVIVSGRVASRLEDPVVAFLLALVSGLITGAFLAWGVRRPRQQRRIPEMKVLR